MQLSQVDPWNGCKVCRRQAELGLMPCHNWTHELRMWWSDEFPAWTYGSAPKYDGAGLRGAPFATAGLALASLANALQPSEAEP